MSDQSKELIDITAPQHVEILVKNDGRVLWVNVDGTCALRICRIKELEINDERRKR